MEETAVVEEVSEVQALTQRMLEWLTDEGFSFAVDLVSALAILILGAIAIAIIKCVLRRSLTLKVVKSPMLAKFVISVTVKLAWAFLIVMVLSKLGVNVGPLIAGLGATGFIVGFACQESLANLAAGMMIALNSPFQVGDKVKVAGFEGTVKEVNMMATELETAEGQRVVIPNKSAWGSAIVNFSKAK